MSNNNPKKAAPTRCRRGTRRGVAAVEFALSLPLLVLLTLATVEACNAIYLQQSLTVAAYEGARTAILPKVKSANVEQQANQILSDRRVKGGVISVTPSDLGKVPVGKFIKVTVSAPMSNNSTFLNGIFSSRTYTAEVEMMKEYNN